MKTKKEPINSFWMSQAPLDDLAKIQEYLKPRDPTELLGFFVTPPPLPPSAEPEEPQQLAPSPDPVQDELLEMYGITPEEFALSAVNEPELWEDEELERLHAVLNGDLAPQAISDIVREHMRTGGSRRIQQPAAQPPTSGEDFDLEDLGSDHLEVPPQPMPGPELEVPGTIDVGNWWESRKS